MNQPNVKDSMVLIVDDNQKNIQVLGNILREAGYRIAIAQNGYKAMEIAEKILPTLILLDVMMPEIDGYQVCENLKSKPKTRSIPVIFITAKVEPGDILEGFRKGGVDYITKPFQRDELLARVNTHTTLENTKKELLKINAQKDRVFSIVSHDLRGPLSSFKMLLGLMLDTSNDFPQDNIMEMMALFKQNIDGMYNMLENLLTWAQSEMQGETINPVTFDINSVLDDVVNFLNVSAKKKNITIKKSIREAIEVHADPDMTSAIMRNLLNNALKFSFKESQIEINASRDKHGVVVSVQDTGMGIPRSKQQNLLNEVRYYTSNGTDEEKGSGLGLKLCKSFAEKNNGRLWFESEEGKGSKFYVSLPSKTT